MLRESVGGRWMGGRFSTAVRVACDGNSRGWIIIWRLQKLQGGYPNEGCCEWEGLVPNS